jgi:hypothetical protein
MRDKLTDDSNQNVLEVRMATFKNIIGQRFGKLIVVKRVDQRRVSWLCQCDCGNITVVQSNHLCDGTIKSCGCGQARTKHDGAKRTEYRIWLGAKQRCFNPKNRFYKNYGGRGITMCDEWASDFGAFIKDIGPRPIKAELERKDNDGPYAPWNCCWATHVEQNSNKRNNHRITLNGETKTFSQWCRDLGMKITTVLGRLDKGVSLQEAFMTPATNGLHIRWHVNRNMPNPNCRFCKENLA